jgi:ADP-ribose diphosphatase
MVILDSHHRSQILDVAFSNCSMRTVICNVDMNDPRDEHPIRQLEDGEFIKTFKVPLKNLAAELAKLESQGYVLCARPASLARWVDMTQWFQLT